MDSHVQRTFSDSEEADRRGLRAITNVLWRTDATWPANSSFWDGCRNWMMMKVSPERLLVESSKLQDHRQQSYVIRNLTVESVGSPSHRVKTSADITGANGHRRYLNAQTCEILLLLLLLKSRFEWHCSSELAALALVVDCFKLEPLPLETTGGMVWHDTTWVKYRKNKWMKTCLIAVIIWASVSRWPSWSRLRITGDDLHW